jgi:hypothetical protein
MHFMKTHDVEVQLPLVKKVCPHVWPVVYWQFAPVPGTMRQFRYHVSAGFTWHVE